MSWVPPRAVRRLIIDPLWLPVAGLLALGLLPVLGLAALTAPLSRRKRVLRISVLAACYLSIDVGLVLRCFRLWLRSPLPTRDHEAWRRAHAQLLGQQLERLLLVAERWLGYRVETVGQPNWPDPSRPLLMLARHAGPGDSFTLVHRLITVYHRAPTVVLKQSLQWDPGLDVILTRLGSHFLPSATGAGDDRSAAVAALAAGLHEGDALLLFPEGGNWTPRRHRRSVIRLRRAGRRRQARTASNRTHVLPPRPGGTLAALAAAPGADVLVVTHTGLDTLVNPGQIWRALPFDGQPMRIRTWLHPAGEVPREAEPAGAWLDRQWAAVNDWIDSQTRRH